MPTLMLDPASVIPAATGGSDSDGQRDALVAMALQGREDEARTEIRALHQKGMSFDQLQVGLLAPAVERLGALWDSDSLSFVDVTIATGTLQRLMHFIAFDIEREPFTTDAKRSICIFNEPGAGHTFGSSMAARFFLRAGWDVQYLPDGDRSTLREIVRKKPVDVLGLSLARREVAGDAADLLHEMRAVSRNPDLVTIAGGSALVREPGLIAEIGADAVLVALPGAAAATAGLMDRSRGAP